MSKSKKKKNKKHSIIASKNSPKKAKPVDADEVLENQPIDDEAPIENNSVEGLENKVAENDESSEDQPDNDGQPIEEVTEPIQKTPSAVKPPKPGSKLALVVSLLSRAEGAKNDDLTNATGWQPHTVRSAISHGLVKKRNYKVVKEKSVGGQTVYRIIDDGRNEI